MNIKIFVFSPFQENTYVIWDETTKESCVIDPGCFNNSEEEELKNFIISNELTVKYLINTHCHIDHVFGNQFVKDTFSPKYLASEDDIPLLEKAVEQGKQFDLPVKASPMPDEYLNEQNTLTLGNIKCKLLFTPGHTPGEYCIYFPSENICITGDVLFKGSIGRTDLWKGDFNILMNSIKTKLLTLPEETVIYPGHGGSSTIGNEKISNSFLQD
ncbi:MBL-fold metallo-hydrolase superfamily [hydrothermal vent metagenome]|uniref:MBL-fold metallo-hydrolase superfamily n=1 Tax=hydrothermal vent metagenome TaxID=652676 RepID=A0A3B1C7G5_9ZZZZ